MSSIVVAVRLRPFNQREIKFSSKNIVRMDGNHLELAIVRQGKVHETEQPKKFNFDYNFWTHDHEAGHEYAGNELVYTMLGSPVLANVMMGFNACIFAYGQTGSGKTYTMTGTPSDYGLIPRFCQCLFKEIAEKESTHIFTIEVSYLEIYNENVRDLLNPKDSGNNLKVRQHPKFGIFVEGLTKIECKTPEAVMNLLEEGVMVRTVAATLMNATSSRSHAILTLNIAQKDKEGAKLSKLSLVDLAGSERASSTGATGDTLAEGSAINKSLTTLGMCLSRLAEQADSGKQGLPIPYRDSSLTYLLMDNLGGNSKTSMLANISPADINFDETLSTLRFAATAKKIKNQAIVNEDPNVRLIRELREELQALQAKLTKYKEGPSPTASPTKASEPAEDDAQLQEQMVTNMALMKELDQSLRSSPDSRKALEERTEAMAAITSQGIFVDWKFPQLLTLNQDFSSIANLAIVYHVREGDNLVGTSAECSIKLPILDGIRAHHATLHYDGLINQSELIVTQGEYVTLNMQEVSGKVKLLHGDLIAFGQVLFRLVHASSLSTTDEFSRTAVTTRHLTALEEHQRLEVLMNESSERSSIYENLSGLVGESLGDTQSMHAMQVQLASIEASDEFEAIKSQVHASELRMIAEFPKDEDTIEYVVKPRAEFQLINESHKALQAELQEMEEEAILRRELIEQLQQDLEELNSEGHTMHRANTYRDPTQVHELENLKNDEKLNAEWETACAAVKEFKPNGPLDPADNMTWKLMCDVTKCANPNSLPFQNSILEGCTHLGKIYKLRPNTILGLGAWDERYAIMKGRFLYYFKKNYGGEKPQGAIYIYGADIEVLRGNYHGRENCIRIIPSVPRKSSKDPADQKQQIFILSCDTPAECSLWRQSIEEVSLPPQPKTAALPTSPRKRVSSLIQPTVDVGKAHWKDDSQAVVCEDCGVRFTVFIRKHHCRSCGGIYCDTCCPKGQDGNRVAKRCLRLEAERREQKALQDSTRKLNVKALNNSSEAGPMDATRKLNIKALDMSYAALGAEDTELTGVLSGTMEDEEIDTLQESMKESSEVVSIASQWKLPLPQVHGMEYLKYFFEVRNHGTLNFVLIDHFAASLGIYSSSRKLIRAFEAAHLLALQKNATDSAKLMLIFVGKNQVFDFVFKDNVVRERFCETLSAMRPQNRVFCPGLLKDGTDNLFTLSTTITALGSNSRTIKSPVTKQNIDLSGECKVNASGSLLENMMIWVGNWNANGADEESAGEILKKWLPDPGSSSVYVFNVQQYYGDHNAWFTAVHMHLGREYLPFINMSQFHMSIVAFCPRRQILKITNAEATIGNGTYNSMLRVWYPQGETGGVAISFRVLETSVCVMNLDLPSEEKTQLACIRDSLTRMQLSYDCVEVTEQFDHVLLSGLHLGGHMAQTTHRASDPMQDFLVQQEGICNGAVLAKKGKAQVIQSSAIGPQLLTATYMIPVVRPSIQCFQPNVGQITLRFVSFVVKLFSETEKMKAIVHVANSMSCPQRTTPVVEGAGTLTWTMRDFPLEILPPNSTAEYFATRSLIFTVRDMGQTVETKSTKGSASISLAGLLDVDTIDGEEKELSGTLRYGGFDVGSIQVKLGLWNEVKLNVTL